MKIYNDVSVTKLLTGKKYTKKGISYSDDILCFDLESSNGFMKASGKIIPDIPKMSDDFYKILTPVAIPYIWQLSINGVVIYGRKLEDFTKVLEEINNDGIKRCIFVHNLGFDFYFLMSFYKVKQYFARQIKHPLKVVFEGIENIEFRCTFMLTRLSLDAWGKSLNIDGVAKDSGYEYTKIRTPLTYLSDTELHYCEMDVIVMYHGILKELKTYEHVHDIPLTQTGKVRRVVKQLLRQKKGWLSHVGNATVPLEIYLYLILCLWGGDVHGTCTKISKVIEDIVLSFDLESSYPFNMATAKVPINQFYETTFVDKRLFEDYAFMLNLEFENIRCNDEKTFIPLSKCTSFSDDVSIDNGRVINASKIVLWCTELDFLTIKEHYHTDGKNELEYTIKKAYQSRKAYLPREFIMYVLQLFKGKTEKKNVPGMEELYAKDKEFINALYGMMIMYLLFDDIVIEKDGKSFKKREKTEEEAIAEFEKLCGHANSKNFLPYQAGVWIVAQARRNLWEIIDKIPANKLIYRDTDSVKFIKKGVDLSFINEWNQEVEKRIKASAKANNIPLKMFYPLDKDGEKHMIGCLAPDGEYSEFVTHGAKKYMYRDKKDGELHLTMSGVNKKQVYLFNDIHDFTNNFVFKRDTKYPSKQVTYVKNPPRTVWNSGKYDEYIAEKEIYGVNIRSRDYKSGLSADFDNLIITLQERGKSCVFFDSTRS